MEPLADLLEQRIALWARTRGLDTDALGHATLRAAIRRRLASVGCAEADYPAVLDDHPAEAPALLEELRVGETWFFREPAAFDLLRQSALKYLADPPTDEPFRVLSLACSSGEELWSIAITLCDAGLPAARMQVRGFDLSAKAIEQARCGIYGPRAFRDGLPPGAERYLSRHPDGRHEIAATLRPIVSTAVANITEPSSPLGALPPQHAVMCRNMLIYQTPDARKQILAAVSALLNPGGLLFLGHAESAMTPPPGFVRHAVPGAFAWIRREPDSPPRAQAPATIAEPPRPGPLRKPVAGPPDRDSVTPPTLVAARGYADAGRYADAARIGQLLLLREPLNPDVTCLLGLVALAEGRDDEAMSYARRTLYLDPRHPEGTVLLSRLSGRSADEDTAAPHRARMDRGRIR